MAITEPCLSAGRLFSRKVSTFFSLLIIFLISLAVGVWTITQAQAIKRLEQPLPFYIAELGK